MRKLGRSLAVAGFAVALAGVPLSAAQAQTPGDWPTYLSNNARTGSNSTETVVTPASAPGLRQVWVRAAGNAVSAEPIQVNGVVYYGSWDGNEYAVRAATGTKLWATFLGQRTDTACNPPTIGVASTATVGTMTVNGTLAVFVGGGDGNFYALNASTGAVIWKTPLATQLHGFLWSSPLFYRGSIYEGIASCGNSGVPGGIAQLSAVSGKIQHTLITAPSSCLGASVWSSPAVDTATGDIYFATGNAGKCSSTEPLAMAVVETDKALNVLSSWQLPADQQPTKDSDFGATPTLFTAKISGVVHKMVGLQNKNGVFYALDRTALSDGPLWQQRIAVGGNCPQCGTTDISPSAWDGHNLFVGGERTTIGSATCAGSIQELQPSTGNVAWADCLPSPVLGAVTAVPGVAFVGAGSTAYAVGTSTGAILWRHKDTHSGSNFWGAATISDGHVYFGNQDGRLYAFGT
ncbi:MAG: outer membrane protein assembly factor BamB family protein [Streptosporangiaceae bacterium]